MRGGRLALTLKTLTEPCKLVKDIQLNSPSSWPLLCLRIILSTLYVHP